MSLQGDYLKACIPEPFRVLGQRLKPYSLGHAFILNRLGSPFAVDFGKRVPSLGDLYFAIWVCRRKYADAIIGLQNASFVKDVKWLKLLSRFKNTDVAKVLFTKYIVLSAQVPDIWRSSEKDARTLTMPHLLYLKFIMTSKYGYSVKEVMDIPYGEALWSSLAYSESKGGCTFLTDEQHNIREMRDQLLKEAQEEHPELKPMYPTNGDGR